MPGAGATQAEPLRREAPPRSLASRQGEDRLPPEPLPYSAARELLWQFLASLSLGLGGWYIAWRWTASLNPDALWFAIPVAVAETCAYLGLGLFLFNLWRDERPAIPAPPSLLADCVIAVAAEKRPLSVDCFFLVDDEDPDRVRLSLRDASRMRYPHPIDVRLHVLDDDRRAEIRLLAACEGAGYIPRTSGPGFKVGNLRNALEKTSGDFIVLCDGGTRPLPSLLEHTLGYFRDPRMAWVQTPLWFFDQPAGDPLLNDPQMLYDVVLRRRNRGNAVFCCGAGSVHRREAMMEAALKSWVSRIDAEVQRMTAKVGEGALGEDLEDAIRHQIALDTDLTPVALHIAQDLYNSIVLHADRQRGWRSVLHPWVESKTAYPQDLQTRISERFRQTVGALDLCLRDRTLFRPGLDWRQELLYAATFWPCFGGLWNTVFAAAPVVYLFTGIAPVARYSFDFFKHALPFLLTYELALLAGTWGVASFRAKRPSLAFFPLDLRALWTVLRGDLVELPRERRRKAPSFRLVWPQLLVLLLTLAGLLVRGAMLGVSRRGDLGADLTFFVWGLYNVYLLFGIVRAAAWAPAE